jgi:7-alpha-hydroxysteroid dehydrogenase
MLLFDSNSAQTYKHQRAAPIIPQSNWRHAMANILDSFRLDGQVAIVTGSGRGIGAGTALAYADAGADVVVSARTVSQLEATAEKIRERGQRALVVPCDVLQAEQREALVAKTVEEFGRVDILVNNAGGWPPKATLDTTESEFDACFRFNVTTALAMTRLCVPKMVETAGGGAIVNISSVAGRFNARGFAAYGVAKAALSFLTKNLAQDFAPKVRVNGIAVGSILTEALEGFMTDAFEQQMLAKTPMKRLGKVEDIAACALYLASPAASYVTGEIYGVNGGLTQIQVEMPEANL